MVCNCSTSQDFCSDGFAFIHTLVIRFCHGYFYDLIRFISLQTGQDCGNKSSVSVITNSNVLSLDQSSARFISLRTGVPVLRHLWPFSLHFLLLFRFIIDQFGSDYYYTHTMLTVGHWFISRLWHFHSLFVVSSQRLLLLVLLVFYCPLRGGFPLPSSCD